VTNQLLNDRYQIIRTLGAGGFGETFLAEDTHMPSRRRCVVKRLRPVQDNPQINQLVQERFQREAAILEKLGNEHRQIPELYAYFYGQTDQQFYLVQEWIDGDTLSSISQQQGRLAAAEVRRLLIAILPVFDFVHRQAIIHRDVKPDNIIVRRLDQQPVLIDFGAVRETMGTALNSQGRPTQSIIIGTPGYMPSEQSVGRPVYSSDLYSLGLTAVYLLTGKQPSEFMAHPHTSEILWQEDAPRISPELAAILDQAIASHPRDRYQTASDFLSALQGNPTTVIENKTWVASQPSVPTIPTTTYPEASRSKNSNSRLLLMGGIAGGILLSGGVMATLFQPTRTPLVTPLVATQPNIPPEVTTSSSPSLTTRPPSKEVNLSTTNQQQRQSSLASIQPSNNLVISPKPTATLACSYFTGNAIEGQPVNVDLCSIGNIKNSEKISFTYSLGNQRLKSTANCTQNNWITYPDQQIHRPLSTATQKMLDRVCNHQQPSNSESVASVVTQPEQNPEIVKVPSSSPAIDPATSITKYYQDINNRDFSKAWQQLPIDLQSNTTIHPQGYDSFVQWWNSVTAVDLNDLQTTQQTNQQAEVQVSATYRMKNNRLQPFTLRYILVWNEINQKWLIAKIRRS
jgi:serine/threonine protein kinase, bacterial